MASLNIKNEETADRVRELAERTGESLTTAVRVAVEERLDRLRERGNDAPPTVGDLLALGRDVGRRLKEPYASTDHDELLYGDDGLPR